MDNSTEQSAADVAQIKTFLITDMRGYSTYTEQFGDEAAARMVREFAAAVEEIAHQRQGEVVELRGDEALLAFTSARQALRAAVDLQHRVERRTSPHVPVGVGLDAGEALPMFGGYRGGALNVAARLCSMAKPGEILASETVVQLARKTQGLDYGDRGQVQLKGLTDPVRVYQVQGQGTLDHERNESAPDATTDTARWVQALPRGGYLGSLPAGPLVARNDELEMLLHIVSQVEGSQGRLVVLTGEPGAGKTRLAQEVTVHLMKKGFLVGAGTCYEPRRGVPYYPFRDVLTVLYQAAPPTLRAAAGQRWPHLSRLLPQASPGVPSAGTDSHEEQEQLVRAVSAFVTSLTERGPVAILLDDLHWADSASLDLLAHLARHAGDRPLLLLGTFRNLDVPSDHPLHHALDRMTREGIAHTVPVRSLSEGGTAALLAATAGGEVGPAFVKLVHQRTDGNPFFTQEVGRALRERGSELGAAEPLSVPGSVRSVIMERLSRLPPPAQKVLRDASVLGQSFAFDDLRALTGLSETDVEEALAGAERSALVREKNADVYEFGHSLTQQTLYEDLGARRRRKLHSAVAEALVALPSEQRSRRAADLAWHFLRAGAGIRALPYALQAGDEAESVAGYREAQDHYRTALSIARRESEVGLAARAEILAKLGRTLTLTDSHDEALPLLEEAATLYRAVRDPVREARIYSQIADLHAEMGRVDQMQESVERFEHLLGSIDREEASPEVVRLYADLGLLYFRTGRYTDWLTISEEAAEMAREIGDRRSLGRAEVNRSIALGLLGRTQDALDAAEAVLTQAEAEDESQTTYWALRAAGEYSMVLGDLERSWRYGERIVTIAEQIPGSSGIGFALHNLAQLALYRGDWETARRNEERALDLTRSSGMVFRSIYPTIFLGQLKLWEGDWEEAHRLLQEGVGLAERFGDLQALRYGHRALAEREILTGDGAAAVNRLQPLLDRAGLEETDVTFLLPILGWAQLQSADTSRALEVTERSVDRARRQQYALALVDALWVHGAVLARLHRREVAEPAFTEAVDLAQRIPYPFGEARALEHWGEMLLAAGDGVEARGRLKAAANIFARLGARRERAAIESTGSLWPGQGPMLR